MRWKSSEYASGCVKLAAEGAPQKRMEREAELERKKAKKRRNEETPMGYTLPKPNGNLLAEVPAEADAQLAAYETIKQIKFAEPVSEACCWHLRADLNKVAEVAAWFSAVQAVRTAKHHQLQLGDLWVTGYQGYPGLAKADHNQKLVTVSISHGDELQAALAHISGLASLVEEVERYVQRVTCCKHIKVCRMHFLDQDGNKQFKTGAEKQAGFNWHNDKAEEVHTSVGDASTGFRTISVLFTAVIRLGGAHRLSALQVLGYSAASLHEAGDVQIFPSTLTHATTVLGGHKVAFFLGMPFPLMAETRFRRVQVW